MRAVAAVASCAALGSLAMTGTAGAAVPRMACSSIVGIGNAKNPAAVTGCNHVAKTGGQGTLVAHWSSSGDKGTWVFHWAGHHGTTTVSITAKNGKKGTCPKGWFSFVDTGKVIGSTGSAHSVIPKGEAVSAHGCGDLKTGNGRLRPGTKLIL